MTPLLCFSITACLFWYAQVTAQLILPRARTHISKKGKQSFEPKIIATALAYPEGKVGLSRAGARNCGAQLEI